jgi:ubiquitin-protein ligase
LERLSKRQRIHADYQRLHGLTHGLDLVDESARIFIRGVVHLSQPDSGHIDTISVEITFPNDYPKREPKIHETGGRFKPDYKRHINSVDGTFCLWIPEESKWNWKDPDAILTWFNEVIIFLDRQLIYEVVHEWTGPQRRHGDEGRIDYLMERTGCDELSARLALTLSREGRGSIERQTKCPCESGRIWNKCHRRAAVLAMTLISADA